jgi:hypothetical protein
LRSPFDFSLEPDYGIQGYIIVMQLLKKLEEKKILTIEEVEEVFKMPEPKDKKK